MKITKANIKKLIKTIGFKAQEDNQNTYYKNYPKHDDYVLKVDFAKEKIEYGTKITLGDRTTSNFDNSENFVVLECVNRVLEKGYAPDKLSLEHKWLMGRREKGKLDILVMDKEDKAYLMIECKTWGDEYEKEKKKMLRDGGQLFSYFQQDKAAQYLCLYTSKLDETVEYANEIIKVDERWRELHNQKEVFDHWGKNYKDNGIFEEWANAYDVEIKALTRGKLKELTEEDSGRIFNQFAEILRHNVVSDKPNAFNKIFNLFLCKIVDEDRKSSEELKFQWLENDTDEELQKRLSDLYKKGMKEYLSKEVTDYNDEQIKEKLYNLDQKDRDAIREMFTRVRLHKNNEFAFKEVFDEKSFRENAIVVREVVELLQSYKIRYGHKQQFLGDFFELLLSTGIKQEAGQFFTPVPIAKFIISSLPIRELIHQKIENGEINFLPCVIDYAAGSGHFLTEVMDEIQNIVETIDERNQRPSVKSKLKSWRESKFDWANDYVYGIEADYRLVKTAKVSCFLNGDGFANVMHADGLDNFQTSVEYKDKLKETCIDNLKDNRQFDILVANPPYSVSAFKNTLSDGDKSFDLYHKLTESSSEIECLFVERAKQLLKAGGIAGIILPSTILSNPGIYSHAREIILKFFEIKAIAKFGNNTFMATGTPTIAIFMQKRSNNFWKKIVSQIEYFFNNINDTQTDAINNVFLKYVEYVFDGTSLQDYVCWIQKKPNDRIKNHEMYKDYQNWFHNLPETKKLKSQHERELKNLSKQIKREIKSLYKENKKTISNSQLSQLVDEQLPIRKDELIEKHKQDIINYFYEKSFAMEKNKILYFIIVYTQEILLIDVGEKEEEKEFIGYEFSNRRGHEGIKMYKDDKTGILKTSLYNKNILNPDKVNYYVNKKFKNEKHTIPESLSKNLSYVELSSLMDFHQLDFKKSININTIINPFEEVETQYPLVRTKKLFSLQYGRALSKKKRNKGDFPVMGSNGITGYHNEYITEKPAIIVGRKGSAGKVNYVESNCFPIDTTFYIENKSEYPLKYIYYLLLVLPLEDLSKSMGVPGLNRNDVYMLKVPLIDNKIVKSKIEKLEQIYDKRNENFNPKKKNSENEKDFLEYFKAEIISSFT